MPENNIVFEQLSNHHKEIDLFEIINKDTLEAYRIKYIGTKNILKELFGEIKNVPNERKKEFGQAVNALKLAAEEKFQTYKAQFEEDTNDQKEVIDLTLPGDNFPLGARHPISIVKNKIIDIIKKIGFTIAEDREIEDDWHNFTALNMPEDHPARDMQDTFFVQVNPDVVLRTHTSSVQVRIMENQKPPIKIGRASWRERV